MLGYWNFSRRTDRVLFCKFEDMKRDLRGEVDKIAKFVRMELPEADMERIVQHCTFDSMKNNPMANRSSKMLLDQTVVKFMRKGQVGDWKNYFTLAQSEMFDELYAEKMAGSGLDFEFE